MATFSDRTVAALASVIENSFNRQVMCTRLMEHGVPAVYLDGLDKENKLGLAVKALRYLLDHGQLADFTMLIEDVADPKGYLQEDARERLQRALMADGLTLDEEGKVAEAQIDEQQVRDALIVLIGRHPEFQQKVILHHLTECERLYAGGSWDAAIGQARNVCEQVLSDIAAAVATRRNEAPDLSKPVSVRNYLEAVGFLDATERKRLIDGIYGYLSEEGSHPGISDQTSARLARLTIRGVAFYLIEKYEGLYL